MISYKKEGNTSTVQSSGSLAEQISDCCGLIHSIYSSIARHNAMAAEAFKIGILMFMTDKESPIWTKSTNPSYEMYYEGEKGAGRDGK